jgi:hypothetical protein
MPGKEAARRPDPFLPRGLVKNDMLKSPYYGIAYPSATGYHRIV